MVRTEVQRLRLKTTKLLLAYLVQLNPVAVTGVILIGGRFASRDRRTDQRAYDDQSSLLIRHQKQIAQLALKSGFPSLFEVGTWVESGGLMSYATNDIAVYRRPFTWINFQRC